LMRVAKAPNAPAMATLARTAARRCRIRAAIARGSAELTIAPWFAPAIRRSFRAFPEP
jgi:hypothetical protein